MRVLHPGQFFDLPAGRANLVQAGVDHFNSDSPRMNAFIQLRFTEAGEAFAKCLEILVGFAELFGRFDLPQVVIAEFDSQSSSLDDPTVFQKTFEFLSREGQIAGFHSCCCLVSHPQVVCGNINCLVVDRGIRRDQVEERFECGNGFVWFYFRIHVVGMFASPNGNPMNLRKMRFSRGVLPEHLC